ncbi:hypothetical protein LEP1GSC128_1253 [Leptospira borgpetersenii str. 200801926]|uniref:Uncharacterized protein n=1 Tax=Leptospira borgpetersenii str. 200801926 TaxID=1193009 RepID=A0ABP2RZB1_LEPBO|nr:hypothetical protein LEP1GSC128_1253 [Leptospira borgpetersenii str. 200801926]
MYAIRSYYETFMTNNGVKDTLNSILIFTGKKKKKTKTPLFR